MPSHNHSTHTCTFAQSLRFYDEVACAVEHLQQEQRSTLCQVAEEQRFVVDLLRLDDDTGRTSGAAADSLAMDLVGVADHNCMGAPGAAHIVACRLRLGLRRTASREDR